MKILFISHDAFPAGAQLLLLNFLRWCKDYKSISFEVLFVKEGILKSEFDLICKTYVWPISYKTISIKNVFSFFQKRKLLKKFSTSKFDLIYSNTIINGKVLKELSILKIPVITHVHELSYWIDKSGIRNFEYVKHYTQYFIAAAEIVKNELINRGINQNQIKVIYEHTNLPISIKNHKSLFELLGINEKSIIIGACGSEIWRKGKDLFVPLAEKTFSKINYIENIHFVWIGGRLSSEIEAAHQNSNFKSNIHFISYLPNASNYFSDFSVFCMLSREDPFPTVNLEAGILGIPVLAFGKSGGSQELLAKWPELIIEYENVDSFSKSLLNLLNHPNERFRLGEELSSFIKSNFLIEKIGFEILREIDNCFSPNKK